MTIRPRKAIDHFIIGDAEGTPPRHVASLGVELVAVDAARPDRDVAVHALRAQDRGGGFRRRHHDFAAMVEAPHDVARQRLQRLQVIISEIGVEARVDRGDRGDLVPPRPGDRAVTDDVRAGDMDDVRIELGEVAPDPRREAPAAGDIRSGPGIGTAGTLTRSPVGGKAGSSTVGE